MIASSRMLITLKILSVAGILLNALAFIVFFIAAVMQPDTLGSMKLWMAFFVTFSVGVPLYAILYASLKNREYLRDVLDAVKKGR